MSMTAYRFLTSWQIEAPLQAVFDTVLDSLYWPQWWHGAERVEHLEDGDATGIGSVRRYTWKSLLPYQLCFDARATRIEVPYTLEATVDGDLRGCGRWSFCHERGITSVHYEWDVRTTRRWMNLLAPVAHAVFAYNHHVLMRRGAQGLARRLGARLVDVSHHDLPPGPASRRSPFNRALVAAAAGLVGGTVATLIQLLLWWAASLSPIEMLLRDTQLAAAIVMGAKALPPPVAFDWKWMAAASLVHLALSVCYGLLLAPVLARLRMPAALLTGMAAGLFIFTVNMYGFTAIFPWFVASRDWFTAVAHASFGLSTAFVYKSWER